MSVIVTANYEGETFEVEIFRDGSLDFPGHDFEYDRTVAALGGKPSIFVRFEDYWTKHSSKVICENVELHEDSTTLMLADFAEHVLYVFEDRHPRDLRPGQAIDAVRKFVAGKINKAALKEFENAAKAAARAAREVSAAPMSAKSAAAWAAVAAEWAAAKAGAAKALWETEWAVNAAEWSARAVAYNASSNQDSVEWQQAYNAEFAWQIRRFVDCMEAIGQGKDWLDMKETP